MSNLVLETVEESCAFGEDVVLVGLRSLTRKSEGLLTLELRTVEPQAEELRVDAARGAEDGGQTNDAAMVSIIRKLKLRSFVPGSFLQRLVDVVRVTKLAHL